MSLARIGVTGRRLRADDVSPFKELSNTSSERSRGLYSRVTVAAARETHELTDRRAVINRYNLSERAAARKRLDAGRGRGVNDNSSAFGDWRETQITATRIESREPITIRNTDL